MKITVPIEIASQLIKDNLITANEHCGYWARVTKESDVPDGSDSYDMILDDQGWTEYACVDIDGGLEDERYLLTHNSLREGLVVMAEKHARHFADLVNENSDAITADVLLQCCLFKEIVYG
jgi:hypothetical protein